jgi:hypothetical protein
VPDAIADLDLSFFEIAYREGEIIAPLSHQLANITVLQAIAVVVR